MLKKSCFVVLLILTLSIFSYVSAQEREIGVGLKLGEPTGLTLKYWLNTRNALDFTLGAAVFNSNSRVNINVNYLYHYDNVIKTREDVSLFLGFGARLVSKKHGNSSFGIRGVGGVAWYSDKYPIEVFLEAAPVFRLFPTTGIDFDMAIGARYYFK